MNAMELQASSNKSIQKKHYFYRIYCKDPQVSDCYIGKTCHFEARISHHKLLSNDSDLKLYQFISENGGFNNFVCECVHSEVCSEEASTFIEYAMYHLFKPTLNTRVPRVKTNVFKSKKIDYNRQACQKHYMVQKECECGWIGSKMSFAHHLNSKKHKNWIEENELHESVFGDVIILDDESIMPNNTCCPQCKLTIH